VVDLIEGAEIGYPGLLVTRAPQPRAIPVTLKRVALAKLSGINMISATFAGDTVLFQPWLTVLIDEGSEIAVTGIYRTDSALTEHEEAGEPAFCLRRSAWRREVDLASARETQDLKSYLRSGQQIVNEFVFVARGERPDAIGTTRNFIAAMCESALIMRATPRADSAWNFVSMEVGDQARAFRIEYSPLTDSLELVESMLPEWLASINRAMDMAGLEPDGSVTIGISRSVPEIIG
jgi:hypothetical protein